MAIVGKLTKLKSAIKRWPSLTKLSRSSSCVSAAPRDVADNNNKVAAVGPLHPVYVGRSRRRYLVSSDVVGHPLFQELVDQAASKDGGLVVTCEVVLFEHLLWILESSEDNQALGSMDELAQFYNCSN